MSKHDDGGPVWPVADLSKTQCHGLSLRDHFAAQAMAAMLGNMRESLQRQQEARPDGIVQETTHTPDWRALVIDERDDEAGVFDTSIAESSYRIADAMIAEKRRHESEASDGE